MLPQVFDPPLSGLRRAGGRGDQNARVRGKVFTLITMLIINNLSVYKTVYTFFEEFTSLNGNDLSVYTLYSSFGTLSFKVFIINDLNNFS